jgi:5-methylcytosine-specific restriction enzyme subunit McrC
VTRTLHAKDLSPLDEDLGPEDHVWLEQVQRHVHADDHVLRLGDAAAADGGEDFIVSRDHFGKWWAGRYIGELSLGERRLEITPRLGDVVVERWLGDVLNLVVVPETAARQASASFIARLMGAVWCRAVDQASRHGPPSFRRGHPHQGLYVRGRLDVRATARQRAAGSPFVASTQTYRDLDNDVSRTLVAAERALTARIGHNHWRTARVDDLLPRLHSAVGSRPRLPSRVALARIRYTPITRPFKTVAELSWRIAQLQGFSAASEAGKSEGLLVDVAELWELFVVKAIEQALPALRVEHGTRIGDTAWLLSSISDRGAGLGRLKPDVLAFDGAHAALVADAKYKRLQDHWPERRQGVDRGDLYQLTSYLARYSPNGEALGALIYPRLETEQYATAQANGPWSFQGRGQVLFETISTDLQAAVDDLRELFAPLLTPAPTLAPAGMPSHEAGLDISWSR